MLIEDYELMGHARRAYLGWLDAKEGGEGLSREETQYRDDLRGDTRLEGALLMDWELRPEFDEALIRALEFCAARVAEDLAPQNIPAADVPLYLEGRKQAIQRVIARLRGEV